jgi:hypothetical protein
MQAGNQVGLGQLRRRRGASEWSGCPSHNDGCQSDQQHQFKLLHALAGARNASHLRCTLSMVHKLHVDGVAMTTLMMARILQQPCQVTSAQPSESGLFKLMTEDCVDLTLASLDS